MSGSIEGTFSADSFWVAVGKISMGLSQVVAGGLVIRLVGVSQADEYFLAVAAVVLLTPAVSLGFPRMIIRFVSRSPGDFWPLLQVAAVRMGGAVLMLGGALWIVSLTTPSRLSGWIPEVVGWPLVVLGVVAYSGAFLLLEALRALGHVRLVTLTLAALRVSFLVLVAASLRVPLLKSPEAVFRVFALIPVVVIVGLLAIRRRSLPKLSGRQSIPSAEFVGAARLVWLNSVVFVLSTEMGYFLLNLFGDPGDVAVYGAALRVILLVQLPLAVQLGVAPRLVAAHYRADGDNAELERSLRLSSTAAGVLTIGGLATLTLVGDRVINVLAGDGVGDQAHLGLILLALGQAANALFGPTLVGLTMTNNERYVLRSSAAGLVMGLAVSLVLVARFGVVGVAAGYSVGIVTVNVLNERSLRKHVGLKVHAGRFPAGQVLAQVPFLGGLAARRNR